MELGVEGVDLLSFFRFNLEENLELSDLLGGIGARSVIVLREIGLLASGLSTIRSNTDVYNDMNLSSPKNS